MSIKINIGTNYFTENKRQFIARQTHSLIQKKYENVRFYNIQFTDDSESYNPDITIKNLHVLSRSSLDVIPNYTKKLPFINDIFYALACTDCDIFVAINSDILITDRLIKYIEENNPLTTSCQRLDIGDINSLDDQLVSQRIEIAGVDAFIINREWYLKHRFLFEDYLYGRVYFDHAYALIMKIFGGNYPLLNYAKPHIAHILHNREVNAEDPGNLYNKGIYESSFARNLFYIWDNYVYTVLMQRQPRGRFISMINNEKHIEEKYFIEYIEKEKQEIERIKAQFNI